MATYNDLVFIRLIAGVDTPTSQTGRNNVLIGWLPDIPMPPPLDGTLVRVLDMWGTFRDNAGQLEYVIADRISRAFRLQLRNIPGTDGWHIADSFIAYREAARQLLIDEGWSEMNVLTFLMTLHAASRTETLNRGV